MIHSSSSIIVLSSEDGQQWEQVFAFDVPLRDSRDPHFLVFDGRLFVYTGCWLFTTQEGRRDINDHLGFGVWTENGATWHGPASLEGTYGHYIWRAAAFGDRAYLCGRRRRQFVPILEGGENRELIEAALLESEDGLVWRYRTLFTEEYGDETSFLFEEDGSIIALVRGHGSCQARICRSKPPYEDWSRVELDRNVGGPLLVKWGDGYLVGGRKTIDPEKPRTTLYWLVDDRLHQAAELPSDGDNSYPGFVEMGEDRALLSYYSSHEDPKRSESSSIYLVDLSLE
jgi:hypothetical protein